LIFDFERAMQTMLSAEYRLHASGLRLVCIGMVCTSEIKQTDKKSK
jgi:hypothetical protein